MGLNVILLPQAVDRARADVLGSRHCSTTPVSRTFWLGLQRGGHYGGHLFLIVQGLATATGLNLPDAVQSLRLEPFPPQCRSMAVHVQFISNFQVLFAVGSHQQNAGSKRHLLRSELGSHPTLQLFSISLGEEHHAGNF